MGPHAHECVRACAPGTVCRPWSAGLVSTLRPPWLGPSGFSCFHCKIGRMEIWLFLVFAGTTNRWGGRWAHLLVQNLGPLQAVPGQDLLAAGHVHLHPRGGGRSPPWALRAPPSDEAAGGSAPFSPGDEQRRFRGWGGPARLLPLLPLPFRPLPAGLRRRPAWPALSVPGLAGAGREGWLTRGKARGHASREP